MNSKPQFVTVSADEAGSPQTIKRITELETYLVLFQDGKSGKDEVRIAFKVPGSDTVFTFKDVIGGTRIVANATNWFRDEFNRKLNELRATGKSDSEVGEEGISSL